MLSIIIPTRNEEHYLPFLLDSITSKNSEFTDYEIIIADGNSQDRTREIARNSACKVVLGGLPAQGRNAGAKIAKGELFLFLDADVVLPPGFFSHIFSEFQKKKLSIASFPLFPKGKTIDSFFFSLYNSLAMISQNFLPYASQAILIEKKIHEAIGGFDEEIKISEDHYYARKAKKFGKFGMLSKPVFVSLRRFEREGRVLIYTKYFLCGLYMIFFGKVSSDIFRYRFHDYPRQNT